MTSQPEQKVLEDYILTKNLKHSQQRSHILSIFLNIDKHLTLDELYRIIKKRYPSIGYATVYRMLKLLVECGLCRELKFEDGATRYEHLYGHQHHDHLICIKCGRFVEVADARIERLQESLFKHHGFYPLRHRMELYGVCKRCKQ